MINGKLSEKALNKTLSDLIHVPKQDLCLQKPFRSAYKVSLGSEPQFTNYMYELSMRGQKCKPKESQFIGTLDYIWISSEIEVLNVLPLPSNANAFSTPLPTLQEPSDHLMLKVNLMIK
jgi:hypothetical protein